MIRKYTFGTPLSTDAVVLDLPAEMGPVPFFTLSRKDSQVILLAALNARWTYDEVQIAVSVQVCYLHSISPETFFQPLRERYSGLLEMRIAAVVEQIQAVVIRAVIIAVISGNIGKSVMVEVG